MSVMDDQAGEDDDYSDDDLDALPDHAFRQLQENAAQSTQQPSLSAQVQHSAIKNTTGLASGLGRKFNGEPASHAANQHALQAPSSDYGDFDEEMLDGEIFDAAEDPALAARYEAGTGGQEPEEYSQREQSRLQRYCADQLKSGPAEAQQHVYQQGAVGVSLSKAKDSGGPTATRQGARAAYMVNQSPTGSQSADVNALQAQVQKVILVMVQLYRNCLLILLFSCYVNGRNLNRPFKVPTTMPIQRLARLLSCEPMQRKSKRTLKIERWLCRNCTPMKQPNKR